MAQRSYQRLHVHQAIRLLRAAGYRVFADGKGNRVNGRAMTTAQLLAIKVKTPIRENANHES